MEGALLLARLAPYRIEIKYVCWSLVLLGGLIILAETPWFDSIEIAVRGLIGDLAAAGLLGMFALALIANLSLIIQVPYTVPMVSLSLYSDGVDQLLALGAVTGMGAGVGEIGSYAVARFVARRVKGLEKSSLFQWTKEAIRNHPRSIPLLVFVGAALPAPDDLVLMPLALSNYPISRLLIPMCAGKIVHCSTLALLFHYAAGGVAGYVANDITVDLTLGLFIVFVLVIAYQIEKARWSAQKLHQTAPMQCEPRAF